MSGGWETQPESPLTRPCSATPTSTDCGNPCTIEAESAQVVYWALPSNVSRDMCADLPTDTAIPGSKGAIMPITTPMPDMTAGHKSAVINGTTYWDNSLYIRFTSLHAYGACGLIGTMMTEGVVTMATSDLYSMRRGVPIPYNLADLIPPVPFSAWDGQWMCRLGAFDPNCQTVIQDQFRPMVAVPGQVLGMQPGWSSCLQWSQGTWDPPTAIQAADVLDPDPTTTAAPGPTGSSPIPVITPPPTRSGGGGPPNTQGNKPPTRSGGGGEVGPPKNTQSSSPGVPNDPSDPDPADPPGSHSRSRQGNPPGPITITTIQSDPVVIDPSKPSVIQIGSNTLTIPTDGTSSTTTVDSIPVVLSPSGIQIGTGDPVDISIVAGTQPGNGDAPQQPELIVNGQTIAIGGEVTAEGNQPGVTALPANPSEATTDQSLAGMSGAPSSGALSPDSSSSDAPSSAAHSRDPASSTSNASRVVWRKQWWSVLAGTLAYCMMM
jgi:hypothetical protein